MKYKLICCEVFTREVCLSAYQSENIIDFEFTPKAAHEKSINLNTCIQSIIDKSEDKGGYDAILLGFGLCGNAALGLKSKSIPLVIPRAHDCCTIFLGSKEKFYQNFEDNFSKEWSSAGYMERGDSYIRESETGSLLGLNKTYEDFVEEYGEDNAKYLWETLHPEQTDNKIIFIDIPETTKPYVLKEIKNFAIKEKKDLKVITGDIRIIKNLINGIWNEKDFLIILPGQEIKPAYDYEEIIKT